MTFELTVKVTLILCAVALGSLLLRRSSAAARHLVQVLGLAAALVLPLLAVALPAWELPVLSRDAASPAQVSKSDLLPVLEEPKKPRKSREGDECDCDAGALPAPDVFETEKPIYAAVPSGPPQGLGWVFWVWAIGAAAVLSRLVFGWSRMTRLAIDARPLSCGRSLRLVDECRESLGVRATPRVLTGRHVSVPVLWGFVRPTLLLPTEALAWPVRRLRVALLHELAHLRRRDGLALLIGRLSAAAWWFHPVAWFVERHARRDCERACDDVVLASGVLPSSYARQLLDIAGALPDMTPAPAGTLAIVGPGQLETRLRAILHPRLRRGLGRRTAVVMLCLAVVSLVSVSSARLVARPADQPERIARTAADEFMLAHDVHDGRGAEAFKKAYELHNEERYEEAIRGFEEAAAAGYRIGTALYNAACGHALLGHTAQAIDLAGRAFDEGFESHEMLFEDSDFDPIRRDPAFRAFIEEIGEKAGMRGRPDRLELATEEYEDLVDSGSDDGQEWYQAGSRLLGVRDLDHGIAALERASKELGYRNENALYNLACAHSLKGDSRKALESLEQAVLAGFDNEERFRNDSDLDDIRDERRFAEIGGLHDQLSLDRFRRWGRDGSEYSAGRWAPAVEEFTAFTRANPGIGRGWHNLAWSLHFSRRHAEARDAFRKQIDSGYRVPIATYNIACTYAMEGNSEQALDWLARAVETGSTSAGQIIGDDDLESLRDEPGFEKLLERAVELDDEDDGRIEMIKRFKEKKTSRVNLH